MWIVIAVLVVGDILVAALWLQERKRHRMSRRALDYWRRRHGPQGPLTELAGLIDADMRRRGYKCQPGRVATHGDAA